MKFVGPEKGAEILSCDHQASQLYKSHLEGKCRVATQVTRTIRFTLGTQDIMQQEQQSNGNQFDGSCRGRHRD